MFTPSARAKNKLLYFHVEKKTRPVKEDMTTEIRHILNTDTCGWRGEITHKDNMSPIMWYTNCGFQSFGGLAYKYCPFCGKTIQQTKDLRRTI